MVPLTDPAHDLEELARLRPRPEIRLIAADMDGTLVDDAKQIPGELWPLVDELRTRGIVFCPASGRQYHNLVREFGEHAGDLVFIADSGAYVLDGAGREISSDCLGLAVAKRVATVVRGIPEAGAIICGKRSAWIERRDGPFVEEVRHYYAKLRLVEDVLDVEDDVLKVAIYDFASGEHNTAKHLSEFRAAHQVVVSGPHWVDVLSPTASKGRALRQVQSALGVTGDQTMAFGDFLNDLEMMDAATWSFAVANAHPLLKERARFVAPANNANGVVRTVRAILGLEPPVSVRRAPAP